MRTVLTQIIDSAASEMAGRSVLARRQMRTSYALCAARFRGHAYRFVLLLAPVLFVALFVVRWLAAPQITGRELPLQLTASDQAPQFDRLHFSYLIQNNDQLRLIAKRYCGSESFITLLESEANRWLLPEDKQYLLKDVRGNYRKITEELKKMKIDSRQLKIEVR